MEYLTELDELTKKHSFSRPYLEVIFRELIRYPRNCTDIACDLDVSRNTVVQYRQKIKDLTDDEFKTVLRWAIPEVV